MSASLRVITPSRPADSTAASPSLSERVNQLQAEARLLAGEHIDVLQNNLLQIQLIAEEIANGGEAYPPGVRDVARRLGEDTAAKALTIEGIMARR